MLILLLSLCPPSDAQTLADIAVSLSEVCLRVSHTECTALCTVCSLPGVTGLVVAVHSDVKASPCLFGAAMAFCSNERGGGGGAVSG